MVRDDEVADGLRQYRKATSLAVRVKLLEKLAPTRDPRVAIVLGEAFEAWVKWWRDDVPPDKRDEKELGVRALILLWRHFVPASGRVSGSDPELHVYRWWLKNEADLRRRAKQLPK
jgi:hypothetical protein